MGAAGSILNSKPCGTLPTRPLSPTCQDFCLSCQGRLHLNTLLALHGAYHLAMLPIPQRLLEMTKALVGQDFGWNIGTEGQQIGAARRCLQIQN